MRFWRQLGLNLGFFWRSQGVRGRAWAVLGQSWEVLGRSWAVLGGLGAALGGVGPANAERLFSAAALSSAGGGAPTGARGHSRGRAKEAVIVTDRRPRRRLLRQARSSAARRTRLLEGRHGRAPRRRARAIEGRVAEVATAAQISVDDAAPARRGHLWPVARHLRQPDPCARRALFSNTFHLWPAVRSVVAPVVQICCCSQCRRRQPRVASAVTQTRPIPSGSRYERSVDGPLEAGGAE